MKKRPYLKNRLIAVIVAALMLAGIAGPAGAQYTVMPSPVSGFVDSFNAKSAALGLRYSGMRFTHISYSKRSSVFALRGPEGLDFAFSDTMELSLHGEHSDQLVTSVTISASPLESRFASTAAYRQEFTMASLLALESLVTGVTRFEAARVLASLEMPFDYTVLSSALNLGYGYNATGVYPYSNSYPYSNGFPYINPVLTDKGVSISETLNNYPITLTAEIESNGDFSMTAKLAGIYPYPTSSLYPNSYPSYQGSWPGQTSASNVVTLSPGVTSDVRVGGEVLIRLEYTEGDGYDWQYYIDGAALSLISDQKYTTSVAPFATKGVREWRFRAEEFGTANLIFGYVNDSDQRVAQSARFITNAY